MRFKADPPRKVETAIFFDFPYLSPSSLKKKGDMKGRNVIDVSYFVVPGTVPEMGIKSEKLMQPEAVRILKSTMVVRRTGKRWINGHKYCIKGADYFLNNGF